MSKLSKEELSRKVELTLGSLDNVQRAEASPWLFTRIKARLESEDRSVWGKITSLLARPAVALATLAMVLVFNSVIVFSNEKKTTTSTAQAEMSYEDVLASNNTYDLVNPEQ